MTAIITNSNRNLKENDLGAQSKGKDCNIKVFSAKVKAIQLRISLLKVI